MISRCDGNRCRVPGILLLAASLLLGAGACSVLPPAKQRSVEYYNLELDWQDQVSIQIVEDGPVIAVGTPEANAALNTRRMPYIHRSRTLSYFARSHWSDTPAHMLRPLITLALERSRAFAAVVNSTGGIHADLRLDTELLGFQQEFTVMPSEFRIVLRAQLVDVKNRKVLATQVFQAREPAATEDPRGGALAAGKGLKKLLTELATFAAQYGDRGQVLR